MKSLIKNEWFMATRPKTSFLAVLLVAVGFIITGDAKPSWSVIIRVLLLVGFAVPMTMLINDWHDRFTDFEQKKRRIAKNSPIRFLVFTSFFFFISLFLMWHVFTISVEFGILSVVLFLMGISYSWIQKVKFLPGVFVALSTGGTLLYPILIHSTLQGWLLLIAATSFVNGRENLKDLEDRFTDRLGGKWTVAAAYGARMAKFIAVISYLVAISLFLGAAYKVLDDIYLYIVLATNIPLLSVSLFMFIRDKNNADAKRLGDLAVMISLIAMFNPVDFFESLVRF